MAAIIWQTSDYVVILLTEQKKILTLTLLAIPLSDTLGHFLSHVYAMSMEPLVTLITATVDTRLSKLAQKTKYTCTQAANCTKVTAHQSHIMKQLMSGFRQMQYSGGFSLSIAGNWSISDT